MGPGDFGVKKEDAERIEWENQEGTALRRRKIAAHKLKTLKTQVDKSMSRNALFPLTESLARHFTRNALDYWTSFEEECSKLRSRDDPCCQEDLQVEWTGCFDLYLQIISVCDSLVFDEPVARDCVIEAGNIDSLNWERPRACCVLPDAVNITSHSYEHNVTGDGTSDESVLGVTSNEAPRARVFEQVDSGFVPNCDASRECLLPSTETGVSCERQLDHGNEDFVEVTKPVGEESGSTSELAGLLSTFVTNATTLNGGKDFPWQWLLISMTESALTPETRLRWKEVIQQRVNVMEPNACDVPREDSSHCVMSAEALFEEFKKFMVQRGENKDSSIKHTNHQGKKFIDVQQDEDRNSNEHPRKCIGCGQEGHSVETCTVFAALSHKDRVKRVSKRKVCLKCFLFGHRSKDCTHSVKCDVCGEDHNTLLHRTSRKCAASGEESNNLIYDEEVVWSFAEWGAGDFGSQTLNECRGESTNPTHDDSRVKELVGIMFDPGELEMSVASSHAPVICVDNPRGPTRDVLVRDCDLDLTLDDPLSALSGDINFNCSNRSGEDGMDEEPQLSDTSTTRSSNFMKKEAHALYEKRLTEEAAVVKLTPAPEVTLEAPARAEIEDANANQNKDAIVVAGHFMVRLPILDFTYFTERCSGQALTSAYNLMRLSVSAQRAIKKFVMKKMFDLGKVSCCHAHHEARELRCPLCPAKAVVDVDNVDEAIACTEFVITHTKDVVLDSSTWAYEIEEGFRCSPNVLYGESPTVVYEEDLTKHWIPEDIVAKEDGDDLRLKAPTSNMQRKPRVLVKSSSRARALPGYLVLEVSIKKKSKLLAALKFGLDWPIPKKKLDFQGVYKKLQLIVSSVYQPGECVSARGHSFEDEDAGTFEDGARAVGAVLKYIYCHQFGRQSYQFASDQLGIMKMKLLSRSCLDDRSLEFMVDSWKEINLSFVCFLCTRWNNGIPPLVLGELNCVPRSSSRGKMCPSSARTISADARTEFSPGDCAAPGILPLEHDLRGSIMEFQPPDDDAAMRTSSTDERYEEDYLKDVPAVDDIVVVVHALPRTTFTEDLTCQIRDVVVLVARVERVNIVTLFDGSCSSSLSYLGSGYSLVWFRVQFDYVCLRSMYEIVAIVAIFVVAFQASNKMLLFMSSLLRLHAYESINLFVRSPKVLKWTIICKRVSAQINHFMVFLDLFVLVCRSTGSSPKGLPVTNSILICLSSSLVVATEDLPDVTLTWIKDDRVFTHPAGGITGLPGLKSPVKDMWTRVAPRSFFGPAWKFLLVMDGCSCHRGILCLRELVGGSNADHVGLLAQALDEISANSYPCYLVTRCGKRSHAHSETSYCSAECISRMCHAPQGSMEKFIDRTFIKLHAHLLGKDHDISSRIGTPSEFKLKVFNGGRVFRRNHMRTLQRTHLPVQC